MEAAITLLKVPTEFLTTAIYLYSNFNSARSENSTSVTKYSTFPGSPNITILNKWFPKNKFTELGADIFTSINTNKNADGNNPGLSKTRNGQYTIVINTGIGKGRLENITDMQNALWLSNALQTANSLLQPLSAIELNELGRTITTANNSRILDARKRTQFILETVDNYLQ